MNSETKMCQNCKSDFVIEPDDFAFYERMEVPPPTFCPNCRLQRKLSWRNERVLYKRRCDAPNHSEVLITVYSPENRTKVYDQKFWWSDKWDALVFGLKYDFSKSFFGQFKELFVSVPQANLININDVDSDYCNLTYQSKNCYLNFASDMNEDTAYLYHSIHSKNSFDLLGSDKQEYCYETVHSSGCYGSAFLYFCDACRNSFFLYSCRNCTDCFGCVNLRNAKYCIFNEQFSKEEYEKKLKTYRPSSYAALRNTEEKFWKFTLGFPRRFASTRQVQNVTGDYIENAKNCIDCYDVKGNAEDCRYVIYGVTDFKDAHDSYAIGVNAELSYEIMASGGNTKNILFSNFIWDSYNMRYSYYCRGSSNCFGCVGLRNKEYCILNRQYSKEEYESLLPKIIEHMNAMPFGSQRGIAYRYGEFFPPDYSPFFYNETIAQEYFPLNKSEAEERGFAWKNLEQNENRATVAIAAIPDSIHEAKETLPKEILECSHAGSCSHQCTGAFKVIRPEFEFYKKMNLSLPRLCPNCRHYERLAKRNPFRLWKRRCECAGAKDGKRGVYQNFSSHAHGASPCPNEFETSYSPERPEIIYCEECYLAEVA
jgi:hypothetical protein